MKLADVRAFVLAVEAGSVQAAAQRLGVTQSSVSRRVQALEAELGAALVDRRTRPIRPTAQGRLVLASARHLLRSADGMKAALSPGALAGGELQLGVSHGVGDVVLGEPIMRLRAEYPRLVCRLRGAFTPELVSLLKGNSLDAALVMLPHGIRGHVGLTSRVIGKQRIVALASAKWKLSPRTTLHELAGRPWVLNPEGCGYRHALQKVLDQQGLPLIVAAELFGPETQLGLVAEGMGFGLVPESLLLRSAHRKRLRTVKIPGFALSVTVLLVWQSPPAALLPVLESFAEHVRAALPKL